MRTILRGGDVVTPQGLGRFDVVIEGESIAELTDRASAPADAEVCADGSSHEVGG